LSHMVSVPLFTSFFLLKHVLFPFVSRYNGHFSLTTAVYAHSALLPVELGCEGVVLVQDAAEGCRET
jgi:hypothetical protein